ARDALKQLVDLGYMPALPEDSQAKYDMAWRETQSNLGTALVASGQAEKAIAVFEQLVNKYPEEGRFHFALARSLLAAGQHDRCQSVVRNNLAKNPAQIEFRLFLVQALIGAERKEEAASALAEFTANLGSHDDLAAAIGGLYTSLEQWPLAEQYLRRAVQFDP